MPRPLRSRFAPVSAGPSELVELAAGYFLLSGLLRLTLVAVLLGGVAMHWTMLEGVALSVTAVVLSCLVAAGHIWTGRLISARQLLGGLGAAGFTVLPILAGAFGIGEVGWGTVFWAALSGIVLGRIWGELE